MAKIGDDELAKLKAAHGKVFVFETLALPDDADSAAIQNFDPKTAPCDSWVFKAPKRVDWMAHKLLTTKAMAGDASGVLANSQLARACLVWPKADEFDALHEAAPDLTDDMGSNLLVEFRGGLHLRVSKSGGAIQGGAGG